MMHRIIAVVPQGDFLLHLTFDEGEERLFDMKPYLKGSLFAPLNNEDLFRKVRVSSRPRGLKWPNGADLCADMLYLNSLPSKKNQVITPVLRKESPVLDQKTGN